MSGALPSGACDSHCHVFGPTTRFPYDAKRTYTPPEAPKEALMDLHKRLGLDRAVIVQPACHGFDNSVTLDAIAASEGAYRGIALVPTSATAAEIAALHRGGMRGVRFNFVPHLGAPPALADFRRIVDLIAPHGWHVVLHLSADDIGMAAPYVKTLGTPFVIDHLARISARGGLYQAPFQKLLELAANSYAWVKISGMDRASTAGAPFHDAVPFAQKLVEAAPERILWGTDWPHPNVKGPVPDDQSLLDLLRVVVPDPALYRRILVDNPARLYGF